MGGDRGIVAILKPRTRIDYDSSTSRPKNIIDTLSRARRNIHEAPILNAAGKVAVRDRDNECPYEEWQAAQRTGQPIVTIGTSWPRVSRTRLL